jgi:hypothetical protein
LIDQVDAAGELAVDFLITVLALCTLLIQEIEGVSEQVRLRDGALALYDERVRTHLPQLLRGDVLRNCVGLL